MAQITEAERIQRVAALLSELHKMPPERHETVRVPWSGGEAQLLDVILIGVDEVLLNPASHRIRSQLEDDAEWGEVGNEPYSEAGQRVIERHVRQARSAEDFAALKQSLIADGQTDPGVMTHKGLMINANTRVVALREVEDPAKRYVRVAVLPATAKQEELALLELRLQMQKDLKVDYTMTNELLFIEELRIKRNLAPSQIARELRINTDNLKKGETEVNARLRFLDLVRVMQQIPEQRLALTFFDRIKYEQLREVQRVYGADVETDPVRARRYLESFLLSIAVGVKAVHEIRYVDADFMANYMLPALTDDEVLGPVAEALAAPSEPPQERPPGVGRLVGPEDEVDEQVDVRRLVNAVCSRDKRVDVPGTAMHVEREEVAEALKTAITVGIKDKKREKRDEDQLSAPTTAIKAATQQLVRAREALAAVVDDPDFDARRRKTLEAAHKKLRRAARDLEAALTGAEVIGR